MAVYRDMIFDYTDKDGDSVVVNPWKHQLTDRAWSLLLTAKEFGSDEDAEVQVALSEHAARELYAVLGTWLDERPIDEEG